MRNLKKFLAVLVVVAMIATTMVTAFGAADTTLTPADKAVGLGLLKGGANGVDEAYLNLNTQRIQTAIIYLRLLGLEDTAMKFTGTDNFADAPFEPLQGILQGGTERMGWVSGQRRLRRLCVAGRQQQSAQQSDAQGPDDGGADGQPDVDEGGALDDRHGNEKCGRQVQKIGRQTVEQVGKDQFFAAELF